MTETLCKCDACGGFFFVEGDTIPMFCPSCEDYLDWKKEEEE